MIDQYLHTCTYNLPGTEDQWDEVNGGWIPGTPGRSITVPCRATPNSVKQMQNQDGVMVVYGYDLAFPADTEPIAKWTVVDVRGVSGEILIKGRLLNYYRGQLHGRGWV